MDYQVILSIKPYRTGKFELHTRSSLVLLMQNSISKATNLRLMFVEQLEVLVIYNNSEPSERA
jgi:hypothetical protein